MCATKSSGALQMVDNRGQIERLWWAITEDGDVEPIGLCSSESEARAMMPPRQAGAAAVVHIVDAKELARLASRGREAEEAELAQASELSVTAILVDREGGVMAWQPASTRPDGRQHLLADFLEGDSPTAFVRIEVREVSSNSCKASLQISGDAWRALESDFADGPEPIYRWLMAMAKPLVERDSLPLVVERQADSGKLLRTWMCQDGKQASGLASGATEDGRVRSIVDLKPPGRSMLSPCGCWVAEVAGAFYGPFDSPEEASESADRMSRREGLSWEVSQMSNPLANLVDQAELHAGARELGLEPRDRGYPGGGGR